MINKGKVVGQYYIKDVSFSKAVLWKDKQLSIPPEVYDRIRGLKEWHFRDFGKGEVWVFVTKDVLPFCLVKKEGQEDQYYFPINLARKTTLNVYKKFYKDLL